MCKGVQDRHESQKSIGWRVQRRERGAGAQRGRASPNGPPPGPLWTPRTSDPPDPLEGIRVREGTEDPAAPDPYAQGAGVRQGVK